MSKTKTHPPSPTQREALEKMAAAQGRLYRWPGGYWRTEPYGGKQGPLPASSWSCGTTTVIKLETLGWARRAQDFGEEWKDTRYITPEGLDAIGHTGQS